MALQPNSFTGKERLQPGARGETFQANLPGYRDGEDRINRTNNKLNVNAHDVPNIKYMLDSRLPVLFKYGFAFGYNQIVLPKGRIVAVDPTLNLVDFDMRKAHNVLTLANGGVNVKLNNKKWKATKDVMTTDPNTGKAVVGGVVSDIHRFSNKPIGIIERNEYTRDDDAFNGIMPGAILTDAMAELPWFNAKGDTDKQDAEGNPWGSAYGPLKPGDLVKSDENGRFVKSPLSDASTMVVVTSGAGVTPVETRPMTAVEIEVERQQVVGQVYSINRDLVPEGAAKYAQWAISDILNFEGFNPSVYRSNNRRGEDAVHNSPHNSTGEYPGYPYDPAFMNSDLHMLESYRGTYDERMQHEYRLDHGIPGLTDGYNAVSTPIEDKVVGKFGPRLAGEKYIDLYFRTRVENVEKGSLMVSVNEGTYVSATVGQPITIGGQEFIRVKYADELQGIVVLEIFDAEKADAFFTSNSGAFASVNLKYNKRGMAGVPTYLDWDGCVGSVKILLQK